MIADWLPIVAKLVGSLIAILAIGWFARFLSLGGDTRIRDGDHAKQLAYDGLYGFQAEDVAVDLAGYSALLRDVEGRHALIAKLGNGFVCRRVTNDMVGRLDHRFLTIDPNETDFEPITLNLGEDAQLWASGLRRLAHA
jgi:hypothetical protein